MPGYRLGNDLRGWFHGEYEDDESAWERLSDLFNQAFPSLLGRKVVLQKTIRLGKTKGGNETERDRLLREQLEASLAKERAEA